MRKRLLNPDLYRDEELAEIPIEARFLYTGLWCIADREGLLEDRPARICADVFPYDNLGAPMVDQWLTMLHPRWIIRYTADNKRIICIKSFKKHQRCHVHEAQSVLPKPPEGTPMVNHGSPKVDQCTSYVDQCTTMVSGNRYTVIGKNPIVPYSESFDLEAPTPPIVSHPKRKPVGEYTPEFLEWFAPYPIKKGKKAAFKAWLKLSAAEKILAKDGLTKQLPALIASGDFCPHAATWLNNSRWEDEATQKSVLSMPQSPAPKFDHDRWLKESAHELPSILPPGRAQ